MSLPGKRQRPTFHIVSDYKRISPDDDPRPGSSRSERTRERKHSAGSAIHRQVDPHWHNEFAPLVREYFYPLLMSALPPKADMCGATRDVCFGPKADITCGAFGTRHRRTTSWTSVFNLSSV